MDALTIALIIGLAIAIIAAGVFIGLYLTKKCPTPTTNCSTCPPRCSECTCDQLPQLCCGGCTGSTGSTGSTGCAGCPPRCEECAIKCLFPTIPVSSSGKKTEVPGVTIPYKNPSTGKTINTKGTYASGTLNNSGVPINVSTKAPGGNSTTYWQLIGNIPSTSTISMYYYYGNNLQKDRLPFFEGLQGNSRTNWSICNQEFAIGMLQSMMIGISIDGTQPIYLSAPNGSMRFVTIQVTGDPNKGTDIDIHGRNNNW